jgi:hypothetical protein
MKRLMTRSFAILLVIAAITAAQTVSAQILPDNKANGRHSRIVGVWDVDVTITNCQGVVLTSFRSLVQYNYGGTGQVVPNTGPTIYSPHMLIWQHDQDDDYLTAFKMFRYDANGQYSGWVVVNNEVSINEETGEYSGSGVADFYDAAGVRVGGSCPSFQGTRFTG